MAFLAAPAPVPAQEVKVDLPLLADGKLPYGTDWLHVPDGPTENQTSARTVDLLAQAMDRAKAPGDRVQYAADLGATRLAAAVAPLAKAVGDADAAVRAEAARAVGRVGDAGGAAALKPLLGDADAAVRREAVIAGARLGDPSFASVGLSDKDAAVVTAAIRAAAAPEHADALVVRLPSFAPDQQADAVAAVGRLGTADRHAGPLVSFCDGNVAQRAAAAAALGRLKAVAHADRVAKLLDDPHPTVRRAAALALTGLRPDPAARRADALRALADPDPSVRTAAAQVLETAPAADAVDPLTARLTDAYAPLHDAARAALLAAGRDGDGAARAAAVAAAVRLLDDPVAERRADGSFLLGQWKSDAGLARHVALLEDPRAAVAAQAATSLGRIGRPEAGDPLVALVHRAQGLIDAPRPAAPGDAPFDPQVTAAQANAVVAAALLGRAEALTKPVRATVGNKLSSPPDVRAAAVWAIGYLGPAAGDPDAAARQFLGILRDPEDAGAAKLEALKALGNLRSKAAAGYLKPGEPPDALAQDGPSTFLALWAADRIHGTATPFAPVSVPYFAATSITDVPRR